MEGIKKQRTQTGYERETTIYGCGDCGGCPHKKECIKRNQSKKPIEERNKRLYVSKKFIEYRRGSGMARERGRKETEDEPEHTGGGKLWCLKQDRGFRRFMCRGIENIKAESMLLAMAYDIEKLYHKIQSERTGNHLFPIKKSTYNLEDIKRGRRCQGQGMLKCCLNEPGEVHLPVFQAL